MKSQQERGSALVSAVAVLMVVFVTGSGVLALSIQSMRRGRYDGLRARALALADAGAERAIYYLRTVAPDGTTVGAWRTTGLTETVTNQGDYTMVVADGTGDNAGKIVITSTGHAVDGVASGTTSGSGQATASGSSLELRRTVRVVMKLSREDISIWNNAVFGGVGQSGKSIAGNVLIAGSVHLLGDGETYTDLDGDGHWDNLETFTDLNGNGVYDPGEPYIDADGDGHHDNQEPFDDVNGNGVCDPPLTVTDMSTDLTGTAIMMNNYSSMSSNMQAMVPALPTTSFMGETVQTLNAKLRVKHGYVAIDGTASVGQPQQTGGSPAVKETLDGAYVNDGWGGNKGAASVYADNGTAAKYDLPNGMVGFPELTQPVVKNGVSYSSYMSYLQANSMNVTGPLDLTVGTAYGPVSDGKGNSFSVDSNGNITVQGIVYVNGDVNFNRNGGSQHMTYSGRGTFVATGNINCHTDLVPTSGNFPINNALGLIARHKLNLATGIGDAQLSMCGAFYAQEQVNSAKQNEIAGTFVTSYFSMTNVPHLFEVPTLKDNLPPGMPGSGHIWVKSVRVDSWRETT